MPFWGILIGSISTAVLCAHTYFLKGANDEHSKEIEYWKNKSTNYLWMINSIEKLIHRKVSSFRKDINNPTKFKTESAWKNLQMLYEFYEHISKDPTIKFKIVFFSPSPDNTYLISQFWYNLANQPPQSHENEEIQRVYFNKDTSKSAAVKAWRNKKTEIEESEQAISFHYIGQEQATKSIIACPVFARLSSEVTGVITISANKNHFFKCSEMTLHEEFIKQFGIRIALEIYRLNKSEEYNDN